PLCAFELLLALFHTDYSKYSRLCKEEKYKQRQYFEIFPPNSGKNARVLPLSCEKSIESPMKNCTECQNKRKKQKRY
ncbi:MAG: hypothetical protein IKH07_07640, partial [Oscillospiraceae bacterium]|nr:hypothetical protein [Oscillospiraceae bacterium]